MRSMPDKYGSHFFSVQMEMNDVVTTVCADEMKINADGSLVFLGGYRNEGEKVTNKPIVLFTVSAGNWRHAFASSGITGEMVSLVGTV